MIFEHLDRTLLDEMSTKVAPLEAKKMTYQILKATQHMHSLNITHRDYKPENMLLSKNNVLKICDFGSARFCED